MENYYQILGLQTSATTDEIKKAYRKLVKKYHPDQNSSPEAPEKFKKIDEAYKTLSDSKKKDDYDNRLLNPVSEDLVFSLNTNIPSDHKSSGNEIVLNTTYSFKELLNISRLSQSELYEIAKKDENIALAICEDKELSQKIGSVYLLSLGQKFEAVAVKLVSKDEYHKIFKYLESWLYDLAISHQQACEIIIKNHILALKLNGQQLFKLDKKYPNTFKNSTSSIEDIFNKKILAYNFLLAYANNTIPIKSCEDINKKLEQAINDADLLDDQLKNLGKKNLNIATIICNRSVLVKKLDKFSLHSVISAHETLAIKFIENKDLWHFISNSSWVFDLAKISWKIYQTVLKDEQLVNQLTAEQFTKLNEQYSSDLINSSFSLHNRFAEKFRAHNYLLNYVKNSASVDLNDDLNKTLKAALNEANLSGRDLEDLGKRNLNLAEIICDDQNFLQKFGPFYLSDILCEHESLAIKFVSNSNLWINFQYSKYWIFILAKKYFSVCQIILETDELSHHLNGEQLYELSSMYDSNITKLIAKCKPLADKLKAYQLLKNIQTSSTRLAKATTSNYSCNKLNNGQDDFEIGTSYLTKVNLANFQKALPWFKNAIQQGHTATLEYLNELFLNADIKYPEYASEYALAIAEIHYAIMRNKMEAIKWLFKAVMLDSDQALDYLGKYFTEYLESIEYDMDLTDLALLKPFIEIEQLSPEQKNDLCHKLSVTFLNLNEPNTYLSYYFLQHYTDPTADFLFELGSLTLQILAEEQSNKIHSTAENKLSEASVTELLKKNEHREKRILEALPYFLKAANQDHDEARRAAGRLLDEIKQFNLIAEQLTDESCKILLQDNALQQYLTETLIKEISQRHSLTYILNKVKNIDEKPNQYRKPSFLLPEHIDNAFNELVNCCPIKNLSDYGDTFLFYKGLVIEAQHDSLLMKSYPSDDKNNLLAWIINLALANNEFAKIKLSQWLYQDEFYEFNNIIYTISAIKSNIKTNNGNFESVRNFLGEELTNRIFLSYLFILSTGKLFKCNQNNIQAIELERLIFKAFKSLINQCSIRNLSNHAITPFFYENLLFLGQTNSLLQKTYPHDNNNNLLLWILNLALANDVFAKSALDKWLNQNEFLKSNYSSYFMHAIYKYIIINNVTIETVQQSLGVDVINRIALSYFSQVSENFSSVLQTKLKLPTYYQAITQTIDTEINNLQQKYFEGKMDFGTLNDKCKQWQSTLSELSQITQHYEKVKQTLEPITGYSSTLDKKINELSCEKTKNYYKDQSSAFKQLESNLCAILKNHYEKDFSNPEIIKPNNQIIYKNIKTAIDSFNANEGKILFKNEKVWKDVLNKVLTGFAWLLLSPVMLIKTLATHSPVFKPFKSEAEKKLEQLDWNLASNLSSPSNIANNSRGTVAIYSLRNKL